MYMYFVDIGILTTIEAYCTIKVTVALVTNVFNLGHYIKVIPSAMVG